MKLKRNEQGFTIIEVVLVLAIAGLIFLMVFLALPALQRGQRDTQRRDDMSRFISQVQSYQSNNKGAVPTTAASGAGSVAQFVTDYLTLNGTEAWSDPTTGNTYTRSTTANPTQPGSYYYQTAATCNGESVAASSGNNRKIAVQTKLEGAGYACFSN